MNKFNKKAVSFLSALMLACSPVYTGMPFTSYAVEQTSSNEAFLTVPDGTTASNGMFTITFDPSAVTVTEVAPGDMFSGVLTYSNIKEGKVTFAFVNTEPMDISGDIAKISYSSTESAPEFTVNVDELITLDETGSEQNVSSEGLKIKTAEIVTDSKETLISVPDGTTASNGMFTITFDPSAVTVTEITPGDMFSGVLTYSSTKEGKVTFAFVNTEPMNIGGNIIKIVYTSSDKKPSFTLTVNELVTLDEEGKEKNVSGDNIKIDSTDNTPCFNLSFLSSESHSLKLKAALPSGTGVTNGLINLSYDPSEISVSDIKACGALANAMVETNISEGNVRVVFISTKPINEESWLEFEITGLKETGTSVKLSADEFYKINDAGEFEAIAVNSCGVDFDVSSNEETQDATQLELKTDASDSESSHTFKASAVIPAGTEATNGTMLITFNSSEISVSDITVNGGLKNAMVETNIADGTAKIAFISSKPVNNESTIDFTITGNTDAVTNISFRTDEFFSVENDGTVKEIKTVPAEINIHVLPEETEDTVWEKYDINKDGCVTAYDLMLLKLIILNAAPESTDTNINADINDDGTVNIFDMIRLMNFILNDDQQ